MLNKGLCVVSVSVLLSAAYVGLTCQVMSSVPRPVHLASAAAPRYEEATILIHRVGIIDGSKPNSHVWQLLDQKWSAYNSLYSPALRAELNAHGKRTVVDMEGDPTAKQIDMKKPGVSQERRELQDFGAYCKAHGLILAYPSASD